MLRLKYRVKACIFVILAACSVCYLFFSLLSTSSPSAFFPLNSSSKRRQYYHRMVVFGDSSVDNEALQYTAGPGKSWTTWLCSQYGSLEENYATSSPNSASVIDSREVHRSPPTASLPAEPLPDLASQVHRYLENERHQAQKTDPETQKRRRQSTVYAISYGLWDTWRLLHLPPIQARESIDRSINTLFEQVKFLAAQSAGEETRIIMVNAMDVNFLPAFMEAKLSRSRLTFEMINYWNARLRHVMDESMGPTILAVDLYSFVNEQLRSRQLWNNGYTNSKKAVADQQKVWINGKDPCFTGQKTFFGSLKYCSSPDQYIFWDSMHLSSEAQKLLANEIYKDMKVLWLRE